VGWSRLDTVLFGTLVVAAAALRLPGLDYPPGFVFDEIFYAQNACLFVAGPGVCGIAEPLSNAHPPLGQWLIASGIAVFGYSEFGWRIATALTGIATVALLYVLARRLLTPVGGTAAAIGAAAAAGLLALDFLQLVHSRVAMLDGFLTFFVLAAVFCVVLDRDRRRDKPAAGLARPDSAADVPAPDLDGPWPHAPHAPIAPEAWSPWVREVDDPEPAPPDVDE